MASSGAFAQDDLISLYHPGVRPDLESGRLFVFDTSQTFLFLTTLYVVGAGRDDPPEPGANRGA